MSALASLGVAGTAFALGLSGTLLWRAAADSPAPDASDVTGPAALAAAPAPERTDGALRLDGLGPVRLTDQHGAEFALADPPDGSVAGPLVMNFFFSGCAGVCPLQTAQLARVADALSPDAGVRFLSVSITPDVDTPERLAAFVERFGVDDPAWRFASSDAASTAALMDRLGVGVPAGSPLAGSSTGADPDRPDHRSTVFLFDADGLLVQRYRGEPLDVERLTREARALAAL